MIQQWVIAYDLPDDGRRAKLAALLEGYGDRAQWSVFEIRATDKDLDDLQRRITALIDPQKDAVRLYPLCAACRTKIFDLGRVQQKPFDEPDVIIV